MTSKSDLNFGPDTQGEAPRYSPEAIGAQIVCPPAEPAYEGRDGDVMISLLKLMVRDWRRQCAVIGLWTAPPLVLLLAAVLQPWVPFEQLARDPMVVAAIAPECCSLYFGALSNIGVMLWVFAAASGFVAGAVFWRVQTAGNASDGHAAQRNALFFLAAGFLSLLLAGDDLFTVHEWIGSRVDGGEQIALGAYGLAAAAFGWTFRRELVADTPLLLVFAAAFFAVSLGADVADDMFGAASQFVIEDGGKFLGVAAWSAYFYRRAVNALADGLAAQMR